MEAIQGMTVIETIKKNYNNIFLAEKKVADFILENPEKAVNANVSELANYSGVSDATVVRMCKHIGYQGYYQLRIDLSRDLGRKQVWDVDMDNANMDSISSLFQTISSRILAIGKNLDQSKLLECANLIKTSKQVHIVAVGNTSPLAMYMDFRLGRLGVKCTSSMIPEYWMNYVNLADIDDVVIAISRSGESKQVIQALELAKEKGLKIISITGSEYSPVSKLSDYYLLTNVQGQGFNYYKGYSRLNETVVIDALLHFVTNEEKIIANSADKPEKILSEYKL